MFIHIEQNWGDSVATVSQSKAMWSSKDVCDNIVYTNIMNKHKYYVLYF